MPRDLALPDPSADAEAHERAVRALRDHLLGAADVDRKIALNGRAYRIAWADRRPVTAGGASFALTSGMRIVAPDDERPAAVLPTGEEQITLVVDGERLVFNLVEATDGPDGPTPLPGRRKALR